MHEAHQKMANFQSLLGIYARRLDDVGVVPEKANTSVMVSSDAMLRHVSWMIVEMSSSMVIHAYESLIYDHNKEPAQKEVEKVHRWLGYIQGVLSAQEIYTIDELRDQTRLVF